MFGAITRHSYLTCSSNQEKDISDSRVVIEYIERPYITGTFRVMHVSIQKMSYQKKTAMHVWSDNS